MAKYPLMALLANQFSSLSSILQSQKKKIPNKQTKSFNQINCFHQECSHPPAGTSLLNQLTVEQYAIHTDKAPSLY